MKILVLPGVNHGISQLSLFIILKLLLYSILMFLLTMCALSLLDDESCINTNSNFKIIIAFLKILFACDVLW